MPSRARLLPWRPSIADLVWYLPVALTTPCAIALILALQAGGPTAAPPPPPPPPDDRPIQELFVNLGRDLIALPSPDTAVVLGAGVGAALIARPADDDLRAWADEQGRSGYTRLGRIAGDGWIQGGAALATYGIGLVADHRPTVHIGSDLIRAQALNGVITRALKIIAGRKRPSGGGNALPSGHTSASFATAAVLERHFGVKAGIPAYAAASFIGWTRVRDNAHWLTDVIVGGAIGTAVGRTVARGHQSSGWVVIPSVGHTHAAVVITRTAR